MAHVIEPASSGRSKCRGCDRKIAKDELRFGEREPNPFGDGEMTLWFHLLCAAFKRPEPFREALQDPETQPQVADADRLLATADFGIAHRRLPRVNGAERASTGRARCRHCREPIAKNDWRIPLVFFEEVRFQPSGFIHASCAAGYLETTEILDRVAHFSPELEPDDLGDLAAAVSVLGDR
jgi:hypothetical protein